MPRQPRIPRPSAATETGLTLVELLVAVAALAALGVGASLALPRGGAGTAGDDAAAFLRIEAAARDAAIAGRVPQGLTIGPDGVARMVRGADGWQTIGARHGWRGAATLDAGPRRSGDPDFAHRAGHALRAAGRRRWCAALHRRRLDRAAPRCGAP